MKLRKPRILGDRLLVRCVKEERKFQFNEKTHKYDEVGESGFIIGSYTQDQMKNFRLDKQEVFVIQVGPECIEPWVKPGDKITIVRWSGMETGDIGDGEYYKVINHDDAMLIWDEESIDV